MFAVAVHCFDLFIYIIKNELFLSNIYVYINIFFGRGGGRVNDLTPRPQQKKENDIINKNRMECGDKKEIGAKKTPT